MSERVIAGERDCAEARLRGREGVDLDVSERVREILLAQELNPLVRTRVRVLRELVVPRNLEGIVS